MLVRDGVPVYRSNEAFTTSQLAPRGPRTAIGQRADGGIVLLTTDGRQPGFSVGMTNFELAQALVRFGAVRGMGLDGGGSSTLAFEGTVLNSPSDGRERAISTALMLQYYGVYAPPPLEAVVSPNGDGVAEEQRLSFKIVRPSTVTATLTAPDGSIAWQEAGAREPGTYDVAFPPPPPPPPPPPGGTASARAGADRAAPAGRGALDVHRERDGRPGARIDDHAPLRGQLDARVADASRRRACSFARAAARRPFAGRRHARRA